MTTRASRIAAALAVAATALLTVVPAASAADVASLVYPIPVPEVTTDASTYDPGGTARVSLAGFDGCPSVTVTITTAEARTIDTVDVNPDGTVEFDVDLPDEEGAYTITATCTSGTQQASVDVQVLALIPGITTTTTPSDTTVPDDPSTTTPGGNLPATGSDSGRPVLIGALLVAAGLTFVGVTRARRRRPA